MAMAATPGVWIPVAALVILRPRSAQWMTFSEQALANVLSIALLVLVAWPLAMRGRDGAPLPEPLSVALHRRGWIPAGSDLRLDRPGAGLVSTARLGRIIAIPAAWLERLSGHTLEVAVALGCLRSRSAPVARSFALLATVWIGLSLFVHRVPWLIALAPLITCAGFTWFERRWDRTIATEAAGLDAPSTVRQALTAIHPEWGEAAVRVARRLP